MQDAVAESTISDATTEVTPPSLEENNNDQIQQLRDEVQVQQKEDATKTPPKTTSGVESPSTESSPSLTVNKTFVVNALKQATDHNRYKTNQESKFLRKFQNEQRKKHTVKNLNSTFQPRKTLYSDTIDAAGAPPPVQKNEKGNKIITPFQQVQKLVTAAAEFDAMNDPNAAPAPRVVRKPKPQGPRVVVDKTLLRNHLRHTSVHNRLQEENEMWEQYEARPSKPTSLHTKKTKKKSEDRDSGGGMYADREGGRTKVTRVKPTPEPAAAQRLFGAATRKLLEVESAMPDRWGHDGFKEVYVNELYNPAALKKVAKGSRKIVVSNSMKERLNSSIDLSDEDETRRVRKKKRRKIVADDYDDDDDDNDDDVHIVSKMKRTVQQSTSRRNVRVESVESDEEMEEDEEEEEVVPEPKRSIVTKKKAQSLKRQLSPEVVRKAVTKKTVGPGGALFKRTMGTMQSDLMEKGKSGVVRKDASAKRWGHDGYKQIVKDVSMSTDEDEDDVEQVVAKGKKKPVAKSRIGAVVVHDNKPGGDSSPERTTILDRINSVKRQISRNSEAPKQAPKKNAAASLLKKRVIVPKTVSRAQEARPVEVTDSEEEEEWCEKKEVDRTTLRNSIHGDSGGVESTKRKSVKSRLGERRRAPSSDGSSFTDSSDDEPSVKQRLGPR